MAMRPYECQDAPNDVARNVYEKVGLHGISRDVGPLGNTYNFTLSWFLQHAGSIPGMIMIMIMKTLTCPG